MSLSPKLVRSGRESPERLWACLRGVLRLAGVMTVPPVCFNELGRMLSIAVRNRGQEDEVKLRVYLRDWVSLGNYGYVGKGELDSPSPVRCDTFFTMLFELYTFQNWY